MIKSIARSWWLFVLRGLAAIIFGVIAIIAPQATYLALVIVFGVYALADGVLAIIAAFQMKEFVSQWWVLLLEGLAGILVGVLVFLNLQMSAVVLFVFVAIWAIITGIMEIIAAIYLRREIDHEWIMLLSGIFSVILGILLLAFPYAGVVGLIWAIGIYAIFFGILELVLAFEARDEFKKITS